MDGWLNGTGYVNILESFAVPSAYLLGYGDNDWHRMTMCQAIELD
jgi:hypothetical protein